MNDKIIDHLATLKANILLIASDAGDNNVLSVHSVNYLSILPWNKQTMILFVCILFQYFTYDPSVDQYDERVFLVYHTDVGHSIIQPSLHKNEYLYHIDQSLSVQKLDLNLRCPEQYFFHFNAVPERNTGRTSAVKICNHQQATIDSSNNATETTTDNVRSVKQLPERVKLQLASNKPCKKHILSDLFFGCFSAKSHQVRNVTTTEVWYMYRSWHLDVVYWCFKLSWSLRDKVVPSWCSFLYPVATC